MKNVQRNDLSTLSNWQPSETGNPIQNFLYGKNCHFMCIITLLSLKFILLIFWIILMIEVTLPKWGDLGQMLGGSVLKLGPGSLIWGVSKLGAGVV